MVWFSRWFFYVLLKTAVILTLNYLSGEECLMIALLILNAFKYLFSLFGKTSARSFSEEKMRFPSVAPWRCNY